MSNYPLLDPIYELARKRTEQDVAKLSDIAEVDADFYEALLAINIKTIKIELGA